MSSLLNRLDKLESWLSPRAADVPRIIFVSFDGPGVEAMPVRAESQGRRYVRWADESIVGFRERIASDAAAHTDPESIAVAILFNEPAGDAAYGGSPQ